MRKTIVLDQNSLSVKYLCEKDERLAKVISMVGSIAYNPHDQEAYSFLIHEIIEQMLSVKAASKIYDRFKFLCNGEVIPENVIKLSEEEIRFTGISTLKTGYILNISQMILNKKLILEELEYMKDDEVINKLTSFRGIGNWTAKMYLIFVLDRQDVLPFEDGAFLQAYKWMYKTEDTTSTMVMKKCNRWKPYSSIAARYLYKTLDYGFTKQDFILGED